MRQLTQVLRDTLKKADERLLVGPQVIDDAGVVRLGADSAPTDDETVLVQTVDYFPPVVDDPYFYGAIAAANSLSDVYAMGGMPLSALTVAGFPKEFPLDWIQEIFRGGFDKVAESGAVVAGGHTVQSPEPHFGFSVTGTVRVGEVTANAGARVGDVCYLTKPLGAGTLTTGARAGHITWAQLESAAKSMASLNDRAAQAMVATNAHACTDITGFGLVGHTHNIAKASEVTIRLRVADTPLYTGALDLAREGVFSGGRNRSKAALEGTVRVADGLDATHVDILFDAETSGGLLIVLPQESASALERELVSRDLPVHCVGEVVASTGATIELV